MVKTVDKSWLKPTEGDIERRWNKFLNKKSAASSEITSNRVSRTPPEYETRQDPEDARELANQIAMMIKSDDDFRLDPEEVRQAEPRILYPEEREQEEIDDYVEEEENYEEDEDDLTGFDEINPVREIAKPYLEPDEDDVSETTSMFQLFQNRNWLALSSYIELHPRCASTHLSCGVKGLTIATKGNFLLHEACRIDPPAHVISALLKANPNAVTKKGEKGYLPLHYACACASVKVAELLIRAYPEAAKIRNESDLMLPLHIACKWGFSKGVLNVLLGSYPEGCKVRDIYAMVPLDYANKLQNEETRREAVSGIQQTLKSRNVSARSGMIEQSGKTFSEVREDLNTAQLKLERMTAEFDHRERSFALMFGREQEKVRLLEEEKERLSSESTEAIMMRETQTRKLELLKKEHNMIKVVQKTNLDKKNLLEKKVAVLESAHGVKKDIIGRLEHEINVKSREQMEQALNQQKAEYEHAVEEEHIRNARLEMEMQDASRNHEAYTRALLEEHDQEIKKFEEITRKFEVLERELRDQIEYETVLRESVESELFEKEATFQTELEQEQARVQYLEQHVERMNELLESEQDRFNQLESLLKETIEGQDEDHMKIESSMEEKKIHFELVLQKERAKVLGLEHDLNETQAQLETELLRLQEFQARETAMLRTFEAEQKKLKELEEEKDLVKRFLASEQQKVSDLEVAKNELHAEMRFLINKKQKDLESEQIKIKTVENKQNSMREVVETLNKKISQLRGVKEGAPTKATGQQHEEESKVLKQRLNEQVEKVSELEKERLMLNSKLEKETKKVHTLEEAAKMMIKGKSTERDQSLESPCPSEEEKIWAMQEIEKDLAHERARVWDLHSEIANLKQERDALEKKVKPVSKLLEEKEEALQSEKSRYEALEQEHSKTLELLQAEREIVMAMREEYETNKAILEQSRANREGIKEPENEGIEAPLHEIEATVAGYEKALDLKTIAEDLRRANEKIKELQASNEEKSTKLSKEQKKASEFEKTAVDQTSVAQAEHGKIKDLQKGVRSQEILLEFERDRVRDLETEVSKITSLLMSEKRKVADLKDENKQMNSTLYNTQKKADILEEAHFKNKETLEQDKNKIKSLEKARDQLQELLQWERSNGHNGDKLNNLLEKLISLEKDLSTAMEDLEQKEGKVQGLTEQLQYFDFMKSEVVRLSAESKRRDMMLMAVMQAISGDASSMEKAPVQSAKAHVDGVTRLLGLDLANFDSLSAAGQKAKILRKEFAATKVE
ncbi:MAG: hypothetical protein SGBAC_004926 [Bacillariaceae sp.]